MACKPLQLPLWLHHVGAAPTPFACGMQACSPNSWPLSACTRQGLQVLPEAFHGAQLQCLSEVRQLAVCFPVGC